MTDTTASDALHTGAHTGHRSLRRQLRRRFALVFAVVAVLGSALAVGAFRWAVDYEQRNTADATALYVQRSLAAVQDNWDRSAEEVRAQIDFMRIFGEKEDLALLRLRAYFSAMEGKVGQFPAGLVLDAQGQRLFSFGIVGPVAYRLGTGSLDSEWHYNPDQQTLYNVVSAPLWLGPRGQGRLVLLRPLDNAVLRQIAPPGTELGLLWDERVIASSVGSEGLVDAVHWAPPRSTLWEPATFQQRTVTELKPGEGAAQLLMRQQVRPPIATGLVWAASVALLALLTGILWAVIGLWTRRMTDRVAELSRATALFAGVHEITPKLEQALDRAARQPDEIAAVAASCRHLMESVLLHDQEHFAYLQTLDILEEGVVELAADGRYLLASPGWLRLTGITALSRHSPQVIFDSIHPEDVANLRLQLGQLLSGEKNSLSSRCRLRRTDAKDVWIEYRFVAGEPGQKPIRSVRGVLRDITQSYLLEKHVTHMALHDALTGLPNRVLMEDRAKIALRMADRSQHKVALGFIDLDQFKRVNDQFGHKVGDELLVSLSAALRQCLRAGDTLARWGGDEFVVLLTDLGGDEDARNAIAKLVSVCEQPVFIDDNEFNTTFSMGVAMYPTDAVTVETLLSQADRAMFSAKQQGRNAVRFFADIAHTEQDRKAIYIQNRLATAIREEKIQTWFQPIVDAQTHRIVSCEALARWHDDNYGWVSPATFIPMAENLGLIREIGQQVWRNAIESLHQWRGMGLDLRMTVNVSRRQLFTPTFTSDLLHDLERLNIPVSVLDLEITESVAMEDAEHTEKRLQELTEAGFGIAIDDFGTGYSSLSQLHDMPAQKIKIDMSFVRRAQTQQGTQLIQAIVKIASAFHLQSIAEGVEDAETAQTLRGLGVNLLQGYHFGRPMSAREFEQFLTANWRSN